jgi:Txe/YoeB family toxin of Txe-Axe toxin-antitoxin module
MTTNLFFSDTHKTKDIFYPPVDLLQENLNCFFSKRIHIQHRIVYEVQELEQYIQIIKDKDFFVQNREK